MNNLPVFVLDTETTDLETDRGVAEVAWVELLHNEEFNEYYLGEAESFLVNPEKSMSAEASAINGIHNSDITDDLPTLAEVPFPKEPCIFVAHNAQFDLHTLASHLDVKAELCTLTLSRRLISGCESHQLGCLAVHCELSRALSHRAGGDVTHCAELLIYMLSKYNMNIEQMLEFYNKPWVHNYMIWGKHRGKLFSEVPSGYLYWLSTLPDLDKDMRCSVDYWRKQ